MNEEQSSLWKTQIDSIYKTLIVQELLGKTLKRIDRNIIVKADPDEVFDIATKGIGAIVNASESSLTYKKCDYNDKFEISYLHDVKKKDHAKNVLTVDITGKDSTKDYVKSIQVKAKKGFLANDDQDVLRLLEDCIASIGHQLNVCLQTNISNRISELYSCVTSTFIETGLPESAYNEICKHILSVFPNIRLFSIKEANHIEVQILFLDDFGKLRIYGSTDKESIGNFVKIDESICGSLFICCKDNDVDLVKDLDGYYECKNTFIYLGNPQHNKFYKNTLPGSPCQCELAILLTDSDGKPYAALNMESNSKDSFKPVHADVIVEHFQIFEKLINDLRKLREKKLEVYKGLFYTMEEYIRTVSANINHAMKQPLTHLSGIHSNLKKKNDTINTDKAKDVYTKISQVNDLLKKQLLSFSKHRKTINLAKQLDYIEELISEQLNTFKIEFIKNVSDDLPEIKINNLFPQYIYDIIQNSIASLAVKKAAMKKEKIEFKPKIIISSKLSSNYSMALDFNGLSKSCIDESRCVISIWDNGIGLDEKRLDTIGNKGVTYNKKEGNGLGLYALKHYVSLFDGKVFFYSKENTYFEIRLVLDFYKA